MSDATHVVAGVILEIESSALQRYKRALLPIKFYERDPSIWATPIFKAYLNCFW